MADAITTKNITSVDEVQSVDNTDKVFVNDNGSFKQISVSNLMKQAPSGVTEETDPTVSEWAKQPTKPSYTADEVGALPVGTKIPTKTSDLTNDSGYLTQIPEEYVTETELGQKGYVIEDDIPEKLPSPGTLTFTGAVNDTYDGSADKTINIPTGGGGGGTTDYNDLTNQPKLNGVTLKGNKTLDQIGAVQKNQGSGNSGKYLSVGSDGNVTLSDPPASGGALDPEQVNQAVENYLTENPPSGMTAEQEQQLNQNTTDVADLKSDLDNLQNVLLSKTKESAYKIIDGYALKGDGTTIANSNAHVAKYPVTFGEKIYIKALANGYGTFQFSSTETATDIVGNPYSGDYDGFIEVPEGAAYVNICFFDGDEISGKYTAESKSSITQKQINALDSLFRVIAYSDNDVLNSEYKNFKEAFGLSSEDEPGDAGEGLLKNGSMIFSNGATLTVSDGKHVLLYLPKQDAHHYQFYFNISDYEKNTTDAGSAANVDNQLPIYTLKKGDTVSISVSNIVVNGGNETYPGSYQEQVAINLRKANSNISCSTNNASIHGGEAIEDKTSISEMESNEYVGALMVFVQNSHSDITIKFDIDVKVNGETIKWY